MFESPARRSGDDSRAKPLAKWKIELFRRATTVSTNQAGPQQIPPWVMPFWRPAKGKAGVLFYLVLIHILAITGLVLFPLPSLPVLGLSLLLACLGGLGTTVGDHRIL